MVLRSLSIVPNANARFVATALAHSERSDGRSVLEQRPLACEFPIVGGTAHSSSSPSAPAADSSASEGMGVVAANVAKTIGGSLSLPSVTRANGVVTVKMGMSMATCVVSASVTEPNADRPAEGTLSIKVDIPPHARFEPGHTGGLNNEQRREKSLSLSRLLERCLKEGRSVDLESLCVIAGRAVWALRCDVVVESDDGNLERLVTTAAVLALLQYRRPEVSVTASSLSGSSSAAASGGDSNGVPRDRGQASVCRVLPMDESVPQPLVLHQVPIASTFALIRIPGAAGADPAVAADPTALEEKVAAGTLTVISTAQGEVMALQKSGELSAPPALLARCVAHAVEGAVDAHAWISARVEEAIPKQYVRGLTRGK